MVVMVSATIFHISRGEAGGAAITFVLLLIATFVVFGRWRHPIAPRRCAASRGLEGLAGDSGQASKAGMSSNGARNHEDR